ncbi:MAG TPA: IS4 family transposase, partial [Pseudonocardiaceae bacterium]|nr:IS4 family transposase [Pseudonocardiaceae bacterium]
VRVIEYSVTDDDGVSEVFALITTLLGPEQAPALELARIYADRWHVEMCQPQCTHKFGLAV